MELAELVARIVAGYGRRGISIRAVLAAVDYLGPETARIAVDDAVTFGLVVKVSQVLYPVKVATPDGTYRTR